jgi:hypothetical protein
MGRVRVHGLEVRVENVRGSYREGVSPDGKAWRNRLAAHYGYFAGTRGADGDPVDVFVGPFPESESVWVINQRHVGGKSGFDEHKCLVGFHTEQQARDAYRDSFDRDWTGLASIVACTFSQLKWWLRSGNHKTPFQASNLPPVGDNTMLDKVLWGADAQPVTTTLARLMYGLRVSDADAGLMLDAVSIDDLMTDPDIEAVPVYDALVVEVASMTRKMELLRKTMESAGSTVKPTEVTIADPVRSRGVLQVMVLFSMSDGQTVSVWFHNPDTTPAKLTPMDELVSWRWSINKKDVTIVVAPERGSELNIREVSRRMMRLVEKNSEAFQKANTKSAERAAATEAIKAEIVVLEGTLAGLQRKIEVAKVSKEDEASSVSRQIMALQAKQSATFKLIEAERIYGAGADTVKLEELMNQYDDLADQIRALRGEEAQGRNSWATWQELRANEANRNLPSKTMAARLSEALVALGWKSEPVQDGYSTFKGTSEVVLRPYSLERKTTGVEIHGSNVSFLGGDDVQKTALAIDREEWLQSSTYVTDDGETITDEDSPLFGKTIEFAHAVDSITGAVESAGGTLIWGDFNASLRNGSLIDSADVPSHFGVSAQFGLGDVVCGRAAISELGEVTVYSGANGEDVAAKSASPADYSGVIVGLLKAARTTPEVAAEFEIYREGNGENGKVDSVYPALYAMNDALDNMDVPAGTFYGVNVKTGDVIYSFQARTEILKASKRVNKAEFDKLMGLALRWGNKERGQYSTDWLERNAPSYLALRHGVDKEWAGKAFTQWTLGDAGIDVPVEVDPTIQREMDDELTYARQGTYSPSYLVENRSGALVRYFGENQSVSVAHKTALADAWEARTQTEGNTPIETVDAAYKFDNATDAFKEWVAGSVQDVDYSPFTSAMMMDKKAKELGASVAWDVSYATLDSANTFDVEKYNSQCLSVANAFKKTLGDDSDSAFEAYEKVVKASVMLGKNAISKIEKEVSRSNGKFRPVDVYLYDSAKEEDEGEDFDPQAEFDAAPELDDEDKEADAVLDGDFRGHPFRGNQYKKADRASGSAVNASIRAKTAERRGDSKSATKAHETAHHAHKAAGVEATGKAKKYHKVMAAFHGGKAGVKLDSVEGSVLDDSANWHSQTMEAMKRKDDAALRFILKDATQAAEAGEKFGNPKSGQYRDEAHYASMEIQRRKKGGTRVLDSAQDDALPFAWMLDDASEEYPGTVIGVITKDGATAGRAHIGGDGKAMVFVGSEGTERVKYPSGRAATWSDDDADLMMETLLVSPKDRADMNKPAVVDNDATRLNAADALMSKDAIMSDDPKAIEKLQAKLAALSLRQEFMKKANKFFKKGDDAGLLAMGLTQGQVNTMKRGDFAGRIGFADYLLTNNNGVMAATRKRLDALIAAKMKEADVPETRDPVVVPDVPAVPEFDPIKAVDTAYLQTFVDGTADLFAADVLERLEPMFAKYETDAPMMELLNRAAEAYSDAAVKAAQAALAG